MEEQLYIKPTLTLLEALKHMDLFDKKLLIIKKDGKFFGLISVGDIQRAIIQNKPLETIISDVLREDIKIAKPEDPLETIKEMMLEFRMEVCPVVDENNEIIKIYFWEDFFGKKKPEPASHFNLPVVIMAGGIGSRLKPLTYVIPKPLIPINEKTILEEIFDRFAQYGSNRFFISVNYKADLIRYYIQSQNLGFDINFFEEDKPLGTAGSLSLLKDNINQTFFVTNCDILIEEDYSEILNYHRENENEVTMVAVLKHFAMAYGTIKTSEHGFLTELVEKPEITFKINSGMYILEPQLIDEIPDHTAYNITDLIGKLRQQCRKVGVFPVRQNSWIDIGDWNEYLSVLGKNKLQY